MPTLCPDLSHLPHLDIQMQDPVQYNMLIKLKQRIAPNDRAREVELVNGYNGIEKGLRVQNIQTGRGEYM